MGVLQQRSLADTKCAETPHILPVRGCLEEVKRLMRGDFYIGRGSKQRSLKRSTFANDFKVSVFGREIAIAKFREKMATDVLLQSTLWTLSGARLICHCSAKQDCHADAIIEAYRTRFPNAFDRNADSGITPSADVLNYFALLRQEPESDLGSSADEGVPGPGAGWVGRGEPMKVGTGYTSRPVCDGLSLASPGRWPPHARRYPTTEHWEEVARLFMDFAKRHGSADLLMKFALGKVEESPFDQKAASDLKREVIDSLSSKGYYMKSSPRDRTDIPIDFRFLELLLEASGDPEVGLGIFASGVRVGPGVRLPRLPALHAKKKRWQLPEQRFPEDPDVSNYDEDSVWRSNYSSLEPLSDKVREVLEDHANRGRVLKLSEDEARKRYPNLVVASLGAQRKDKKDGSYTARVLFDGTNGISVNKRVRVRNQERSPIAADIKRLLREKQRWLSAPSH